MRGLQVERVDMPLVWTTDRIFVHLIPPSHRCLKSPPSNCPVRQAATSLGRRTLRGYPSKMRLDASKTYYWLADIGRGTFNAREHYSITKEKFPLSMEL